MIDQEEIDRRVDGGALAVHGRVCSPSSVVCRGAGCGDCTRRTSLEAFGRVADTGHSRDHGQHHLGRAARRAEYRDPGFPDGSARGYPDVAASLEAVVRVHRVAGQLLRKRGCVLTGVADEGGWGPRLPSNEEALTILPIGDRCTGVAHPWILHLM